MSNDPKKPLIDLTSPGAPVPIDVVQQAAAAQAELELERKRKPVAVFVPPGHEPPEGFVPLKSSGLNRFARRKVEATVGKQLRRQEKKRPPKGFRNRKPYNVADILEELTFGKR